MSDIVKKLSNAKLPEQKNWKNALKQMEAIFVKKFLNNRPKTDNEINRLNLGCGDIHLEGWINADFILPHQVLKGMPWPNWSQDVQSPWNCEEGVFDGIFSEHMLEHLNYSGALIGLQHCFDALKAGGYIRLVIPDLVPAIKQYNSNASNKLGSTADAILRLSRLTQCYGHVSIWDANLLCSVLQELGFVDASEVAYGEGNASWLIGDRPERKSGSFYVEARKP